MATASTATMAAAAGFDKRPASTASSLQTPASGTFPSEMLSPMANSPAFMKKDDALKTPITPPSAYLDFLKTMTPSMLSPASTGTSARFSFHDKAVDRPSDRFSDVSGPKSATLTPPTSEPPLSRNPSYGSNGSNVSSTSNPSNIIEQSITFNDAAMGARRASKPDTPRIIIPSSSFAKPALKSATSASGRTPRRTHHPLSPFSPAITSAQTVQPLQSPYALSSTPLSAAPWSASFSPKERPATDGSQSGRVSVRHVVTRTVTYCRTPLDPAPRGKRRKIEETMTTSSSSKASSEEPPVKQEKLDDAASLLSEQTDDSATDTDATDSTSVASERVDDVATTMN